LGAALLSLVGTGVLFARMGGEFVPTLDEGDFVIQPVLKTGTSLTKTIEMTTRMEQILMDKFPEVNQIVCRIGAAEVPTDPMSMEEIDMIIKLHPKSEWTSAETKEELAEQFKEALSIIPGIEYEFTQPIEMRFNELITGVRADIAIKIFGEDLAYLDAKASEIKQVIEGVPGAADIILEKTVGLPQMSVVYDRSKIAYYGADIAMLNRYLTMAFGGETTGVVFEGEKRFDLVVRLPQKNRQDLPDIENLLVPLESGHLVPLTELATISYGQGPAKISRENTSRRVVVSVNVRNRDLKSVVADIEQVINKHVSLQPGYYIQYGGQFENLKNATKRLMFAVPLALALIFIFLHFAFNSLRDALLIFSAVPLSTVGGVVALWLRDMPFSVSAGIGFIALFGIAVLNGIVLIEHLKELKLNGKSEDIRSLIIMGTKDRLRPVMLTASAAAMGFLPMAISSGAGAEVQRPLATVVVGGLVTSTLLTMVALPLLFELFYNVKRITLFPFRVIRNGAMVVGLVALTSSSLWAQAAPSNKVTLEQAIAIAVDNNRQLAAFQLRIDESRHLASTAYAIDKTQLYYERDENNIAANGQPLNVLGLEQRFSFPTVYGTQKKANNIQSEVAENAYEKQRLLLEKGVTEAYYSLVYLQNRKALFQQVDSVYANFSSNAEARFRQGAISQIEKLNALAKHQQVIMQLKQLDYELIVAETLFNELLQTDSLLIVPFQELSLLELSGHTPDQSAELAMLTQQEDYQNALLQVEKHKLLPDISLGYFNGTNSSAGAAHYSGVYAGLAIPLFFGEQRARIKAGKVGVEISRNMQEHYRRALVARYKNMQTELLKHQENIAFYEQTGKALSKELLRSAHRSYEVGEMNALQFIMTMENALQLMQDYYNSMHEYNKLVLEINYLQ
jgi:cobalt-zinc-cadmium resistance protein CzcA